MHRKKLNAVLAAGLLTLIGIMTWLNLSDFSALPNAQGELTDRRLLVLWQIRWPQITLAMLSGAVLAITGSAMQGLLQNPLASPGLLGSSSGATTASVVLLYYFSASSFLLLMGGVAGALLAFLLVYCMARRYGITMMILAGVAINALFAAMITLLLSNAKSPWALAELYRWLQGSIAMAQFEQMVWALPFIALGVLLIALHRRYIDLLTFGQDSAETMGINSQRSFLLTALGIAMCVGAIIPQTGVIGFVGLVAPHLARMCLRERPSRLYVTSALFGALIVLVAHFCITYITIFQRLYIGTLIAIVGAPFLVWMIWQLQHASLHHIRGRYD